MHYLVMEYIEGCSLLQLLKREGPLPPRKAADFLRQAAIGMQHAHDAGLVHRDLKPANLMVDQHGVVKILDLGLALMAEEEMDLTRGAVLGSAAYMAPEQAMDSHHVDARADIYALGATFYQCLTGRSPQSESMLAPPPRPTAAGDVRLFNRMLDLLRRMMSTGPADRPQTAAAVAKEVASWPLPQAAQAPKTRLIAAKRETPDAAATVPDMQKARVTRLAKDAPPAGKAQDTPIVAARMTTLAKEGKGPGGKAPALLSSGRKTVLADRRPVPASDRPVTVPVVQRKAKPTPKAPAIEEIVPLSAPAAARSATHWLWLLAGAGLTGVVVIALHLLRVW
jgi:serine/threonine protein kinase